MGKPSHESRYEPDPPRWKLTLVALAILAIVGVLFNWMSTTIDPHHEVAGRPGMFRQMGPITDFSEFSQESRPENLVGRVVILENVIVREVPGDFTFWIGETTRGEVPVVLRGERTERQREEATDVRVGQNLKILGIVDRMSHPLQIDRPGFLDEAERERLAAEPVYISADRVEILGDHSE